MHRFWKSLIIATGAIGLSGAAMAADIVRPPPPVKPIVVAPRAYDWSGHYIGVQGGWDSNHATTDVFSTTETGGIFGVYGGWNWQHAGNWVFGFDASFNWDKARGGDSSAPLANDAGPTWKGFLRGRLGVGLDRVLLYGTAGAAVMRYTASVDTVGTGTATPWGWTAGLGAEWAVHSNWTMRLDWAYQDYGTFNLSCSSCGTYPTGIDGTPVHVTANTFTIGVGMKF
jgi:outer membrane immunogenic protein